MTSLTFALSGSGFSWTAAAGVMSLWPTGPTHKHTNTRKSAVAAVILHTLKQQRDISRELESQINQPYQFQTEGTSESSFRQTRPCFCTFN